MIDFPVGTTGQIFTAAGASWRYDGVKWVAYGAGTSNDVGRNLIHNPLFNIAQRGAGPFTASAYALDRWSIYSVTAGTHSVTQAAISDASRAQIGDESASFSYTSTFTGSATAGAFCLALHGIENVRRLAGKTVTVSFYASASAALKLGVSIDQNFGAGGSPSAQVTGVGQSVTLSTTYTRYSLVFAVASVAGKTLGTSGGDNTGLNFWFSAEATNNTRSGSVGVQSGTINLWGVQLEIGSTATPLEKPDPQQDLAKCQRFCQTNNFQFNAYATAGVNVGYALPFITTMRATPTVVPTFTTQNNCSGGALVVFTTSVLVYSTVTAAAAAFFVGSFFATADL